MSGKRKKIYGPFEAPDPADMTEEAKAARFDPREGGKFEPIFEEPPQTEREAAQEGDEAAEAEGADAAEIPAEAPDNPLREALEIAEKKCDEYLALVQRSQADFINYKRRNQAARADAHDTGVRETLAALLPPLDTLNRAVDAIGMFDEGQLAEGVRMTLRQLMDIMTKLGLEEIPAQGERFDPEVHNAVMREQGEDPGVILEVLERGYRVKERVIRYAMVKVSCE
jgi:molecular chaperone GrpE